MEKNKIFLFIVIALIVGFSLGYIIGKNITGKSILDDCKCGFVNKEANYEITGQKECSGEKGIILGTYECSTKIKNKEPDQSAKFRVNFNCHTVDISKPKQSEWIAISPDEEKEFTISFNEAGMNNQWKCELANIETSTVQGCIAIN